MRQGWSASSCLEISKATCLQAEGLAEGRAEGLAAGLLIRGEDAGEGHEAGNVIEDITQDNHEGEVGEVVQGLAQLRRGGVSRHLMKILNDMWGEAEHHSSLLKAKKIMRPHLKMVDDWLRSVITRPHLKKVDDWSILEPSRVLMMLESSQILENIKPSRVMIFGYSVLVVEVVQRVLQKIIQGVEQEVCAHGILLAEVVHEVLHEVVQDVIQGAEQEGCVQGIVEVVQALVQEVIQGAEQEGDAQGMLVDTKMQSNLKISKAKEEQEIVSQQRTRGVAQQGSSCSSSGGARIARRSLRSSSSSYSRSSSEGSSEVAQRRARESSSEGAREGSSRGELMKKKRESLRESSKSLV
ncbi:unnamed protein product [Arabidopsis lyrata]|nr:unnamed protein product [Arabidopsis lyrata]